MSFSILATALLLAQAGAATPAASPAGPGAPAGPPQVMNTIVMAGFMIVMFYFVLIRPQQKKQKEMQALLSSIKNNDKVVTTAGLHGVVTQVKDRTVVLRVDEGVKLEFEKSAISAVLKKAEAAAEASAKS